MPVGILGGSGNSILPSASIFTFGEICSAGKSSVDRSLFNNNLGLTSNCWASNADFCVNLTLNVLVNFDFITSTLRGITVGSRRNFRNRVRKRFRL